MTYGKRVAAATATMAMLALAACGSDGGAGSSGSDAASAPDAATALTAAKDYVDNYLEGSYGELPSDANPIEKGKEVWVIDCDSKRSSCADPGNAIAAAGELVGWKVNHVDAKSTPAVASQLIDQAVAAGADGVVVVAIDCPNIKQSVANATDAGVAVYGNFALDCDELDKGKPLFSAVGSMFGQEDFSAAQQEQGELQAAYVATELGENGGKVVLLDVEDSFVAHAISQGAARGLKKYCPQCEVKTLKITLKDLGGGLQAKMSTILNQNPDAKAIVSLFDAVNEVGASPAVRDLGLKGLVMTGSQGTPNAIKQIGADGPQTMTVTESPQLQAYEAIDSLNLLFRGEKPVPSINGWKLVDKDNYLPTDGNKVDVPFDFETLYKSRWGLS